MGNVQLVYGESSDCEIGDMRKFATDYVSKNKFSVIFFLSKNIKNSICIITASKDNFVKFSAKDLSNIIVKSTNSEYKGGNENIVQFPIDCKFKLETLKDDLISFVMKNA